MLRPDPKGDIFLSVVIPAYDEEERIVGTLNKIGDYLRRQKYTSETIVVDDGSRDRTAELAAAAIREMKNAQIVRLPKNLGKGAAVKEGILQARGNWILFSDADLSTPIEELEKFLPWIDGGCDVVIGSRALPESDIQIRQFFVRELMGKVFNVFVRLMIIKGIRDTQCGFKLFRREAARHVFPRVKTKGFGFDVEALYLCRCLGYRIQQVPVVWRNSPPSKVKIVKGSLRMFLDLMKIRRLHK